MVTDNYKIRVKQGDVEIDVEGDKQFVESRFDSLATALKVKRTETVRTERPKTEKKALVIKPVKEIIEKKKPGRKPKAKAVEEKPAKVVADKKKPGRKPKAKAVEEKPVKVVAEKKKRGRKPKAKVAEPAKPEAVKTPKKEQPKPAKKVREDQKDKDLAALIKMKGAKKDSDIIVLAGYYINKNQKKREFRSNEVIDVLKKFNIPEPGNVNYYLRKLSDDKGLLTHGRKQGRYKVSDNGIKWVEYN